MYPAVPMRAPSRVSSVTVMSCRCAPWPFSRSENFASPKSRIFANPSFVTMTFSGLRARWERARVEDLPQRSAVDELHDDERRRGRLADLVDRDDVRMVQSRGGAGL